MSYQGNIYYQCTHCEKVFGTADLRLMGVMLLNGDVEVQCSCGFNKFRILHRFGEDKDE